VCPTTPKNIKKSLKTGGIVSTAMRQSGLSIGGKNTGPMNSANLKTATALLGEADNVSYNTDSQEAPCIIF
jgi:hypothetical protein